MADTTATKITDAIKKLQDALAKEATNKRAARKDIAEAAAILSSILDSGGKGTNPETGPKGN